MNLNLNIGENPAFVLIGSMSALSIRYALSRFYCTMEKSQTNSSLKHCLENVKKYDYENYLCSMMLPKHLVLAAIPIRALNVELAMVQDIVNEEVIGRMRFQFWEDCIDQLYKGSVPNHPICQQLAKVIDHNKLSKTYFKRLILSRRDLLVSRGFSSVSNIEDYGHSTHNVIFLLLLQASGISSIDSEHASSHLGKSLSLTNLLRGVVHDTRRNRVSVPLDLLMKYNVSQEQILRCTVEKNVKDLTFDVASMINSHLEKVEMFQKNTDRISKLIFLPAVCIRNYLKKLRAYDFNIFQPELQQKDPTLIVKIFWRKIFC